MSYLPWDEYVKFLLSAARTTFPAPPAPQVRNIFHRSGQDAEGNSAVWLWVILDDAAPAQLNATAHEIRRRIWDTLQSNTLDTVPYIRFATQSEASAQGLVA